MVLSILNTRCAPKEVLNEKSVTNDLGKYWFSTTTTTWRYLTGTVGHHAFIWLLLYCAVFDDPFLRITPFHCLLSNASNRKLLVIQMMDCLPMDCVLQHRILKKVPHSLLNGIHGGTLQPYDRYARLCFSDRLSLDSYLQISQKIVKAYRRFMRGYDYEQQEYSWSKSGEQCSSPIYLEMQESLPKQSE